MNSLSPTPTPPSRRLGPGALLALLASGLLALAGTALAQSNGSEPVRVVATVGMIGDVAATVASDCADVTTLMGPGTDPHLFQASASDVRAMQRADLILYGGLFLEGQLGEVLDRLGRRVPVLAVSEAAVPPELRIATTGSYGVDPHVWMDASLWARTAVPIGEAIAALVPDCSAAITARAEAYRTQLEALSAWTAAAVATVPAEQRILVTAHDAFAYFGRAYDIEVAGIQGISTEAEAGIGDIRGVVDLMVTRGVPAIFVESTINPRTVEAVVAAARERGHQVAIGEQLYSDAMGQPSTPDGTYIGMLVHNTRAIVRSLGGEIAALPVELAPWAERWSER